MKETDNVQLCEVGDKFYRVCKIYKKQEWYLDKITIVEVKQSNAGRFSHWYYHDDKGRSYFNRNIRSSCYKTQEEGEKEIQRRKNLIKKRELLKEYERKLNEELNIGNHYIIK